MIALINDVEVNPKPKGKAKQLLQPKKYFCA